MKKLKAKYTYRQALDLCCFMDGINDLKVGIYRDRPAILISNQDDIENFRGFISSTLFRILPRNSK